MLAAMTDPSDILRRVEEFLATHQMAPTTFGRRAVSDANFVSRLRSDANMTIRTLDRVRAFMASYPAPAEREAQRAA